MKEKKLSIQKRKKNKWNKPHEGHTKEHNSRNTNKRYRNWFFTLNNYKQEEIDHLLKLDIIKAYAFQEEIGLEGTPHLQGVLTLTDAKTFAYVKESINERAHWERCKNIWAARNYCSKFETRNGKQWTKGFAYQSKPSDPLKGKKLRSFQKKVIEIIEELPDDRTIHWFYDKQGNTGKTSLCKHLVLKYNALIVGGRHQDAYFGIIEAQKRKQPINIVVFDIPRSNAKHDFSTGEMKVNVSYTGIEGIKNGIFFSTKYESRSCVFNSPHVIIFSNYPPDRTQLSTDRWRVHEIKTLAS